MEYERNIENESAQRAEKIVTIGVPADHGGLVLQPTRYPECVQH
jgi:hypothetical protein